ncbi:MAG: hypothetical protein AAF191_09530 [Verrucomicrobiota bacterium]
MKEGKRSEFEECLKSFVVGADPPADLREAVLQHGCVAQQRVVSRFTVGYLGMLSVMWFTILGFWLATPRSGERNAAGKPAESLGSEGEGELLAYWQSRAAMLDLD